MYHYLYYFAHAATTSESPTMLPQCLWPVEQRKAFYLACYVLENLLVLDRLTA